MEKGIKAERSIFDFLYENCKHNTFGKVEFTELSLDSSESVKQIIHNYINVKKYPLHIFVNNAGHNAVCVCVCVFFFGKFFGVIAQIRICWCFFAYAHST